MSDQPVSTPRDFEDYNWGGDGSDLHEPVRAYVEAALVPTTAPYSPPVDELLRLGSALEEEPLARFDTLNLTQADVPELVRMSRDRNLNIAMDDADESWAPIHAIEALKSLDVRSVVADLVPLFDVESEWFGEELPGVLGNAGEAALGPVERYVHDRTRWIYGRANAASALERIAEKSPETRARVVQTLSDELEHATENDPSLNGFFVGNLIHLNAVEALPVIRSAFEQNAIDRSITGTWTMVLEELGQTPDPDDPLVRQAHERASRTSEQRLDLAEASSHTSAAIAPTPKRSKQGHAAKRKNKRKMSSASRKAGKRKKR